MNSRLFLFKITVFLLGVSSAEASILYMGKLHSTKASQLLTKVQNAIITNKGKLTLEESLNKYARPLLCSRDTTENFFDKIWWGDELENKTLNKISLIDALVNTIIFEEPLSGQQEHNAKLGNYRRTVVSEIGELEEGTCASEKKEFRKTLFEEFKKEYGPTGPPHSFKFKNHIRKSLFLGLCGVAIMFLSDGSKKFTAHLSPLILNLSRTFLSAVSLKICYSIVSDLFDKDRNGTALKNFTANVKRITDRYNSAITEGAGRITESKKLLSEEERSKIKEDKRTEYKKAEDALEHFLSEAHILLYRVCMKYDETTSSWKYSNFDSHVTK